MFIERTEDESRVGRDRARGALAVAESRRNGDETFTTDLHTGNTLVPALDNLTLAELELELCETKRKHNNNLNGGKRRTGSPLVFESKILPLWSLPT